MGFGELVGILSVRYVEDLYLQSSGSQYIDTPEGCIDARAV